MGKIKLIMSSSANLKNFILFSCERLSATCSYNLNISLYCFILGNMVRRRKVPISNKEAANADPPTDTTNDPIYYIMSKVQLNETHHNKYLKELKQFYDRMDHGSFTSVFIKMLKTAMVTEETNEFANNTLLFCGKFITSFDNEDTHPLLADIFNWLLTTISADPHIRLRLCQFVNIILSALGHEATLDDVICDNIMEYMVNRLLDISPSVRVQAVLAMQRLQVPDNPDDPVLRSYQYHLCADPSPRVRMIVITCMGRNYHTIPYILDRLWDIDEKVRRHTYLHMSSYPVRSYKVSQRLTLLEQGLNDRSVLVRKVVINVMLQQWIESYQKDLVALIGALKLDASAIEVDRFRKIAQQALNEIFRNYQNKNDIISCLSLDTENEYYRCVPFDKLTLEMALYWKCLVEYLQLEGADEIDQILPELSKFCNYIENYCKTRKTEMDKFETIEFENIVLCLMEILYNFDLGDEIGRNNLKQLLEHLLKTINANEKIIEMIVKCSENLITDQSIRHQFFLDIIQDICGLNNKQKHIVHDRNLISELLANSADDALNLKLSSLKVKILDLEEQETNLLQMKDYTRFQQIVEEKNLATAEFTKLLHPLLDKRNQNCNDATQPQFTSIINHESILKGLQVTFYMIASKHVQSLAPITCRLYNDFIFRYIASNKILLRDWALKCGAALSMHYEILAKEVFGELYAQFFRNHNIRIWETSITCIFELIDRYGLEKFTTSEEENKGKKATMRQLYNTLSFVDETDEESQQNRSLFDHGVGVMYIMSHFLDTCDDASILRCIVNGFCRLLLHGRIDNRDIMEKLLQRYFDPSTVPEINQILGIFLQNLIEQRKHNVLQICLMSTINSVLSAPYDSPLHDIRPDTITRFIIDATRPQSVGNNMDSGHNKLALAFLQEMLNNPNNKELCKLLSKELLNLELKLTQNEDFKKEVKQLTDKLIKNKLDTVITKKIVDFKRIVDGVYNPLTHRGSHDVETDDDDDEGEGEGENEGEQNADEGDAACETGTLVRTNVSSMEQEKQNSEQNQTLVTVIANISLAEHYTPTTFGSKNTSIHRCLRRSLNISRNNSTEMQNDSLDNGSDVRKIRIEARIDSDKKATSDNQLNNRNINTRGQQEFVENMTKQSNQTSIETDKSNAFILETSTQRMSISDSDNTSSETITNDKQINRSLENKQKSVHSEKNSGKQVQSKNPTNLKRISKSNDFPDVIPPSPEISKSSSMLTRITRSRALNLRTSQRTTKLIDEATPVRNGRKRILRATQKSAENFDNTIVSPVRKQIYVSDLANVSKTNAAPVNSVYKTTINQGSNMHVINKNKSINSVQTKRLVPVVRIHRKNYSTIGVTVNSVRESSLVRLGSHLPVRCSKQLKQTVNNQETDNKDNRTVTMKTRIPVRRSLRQRRIKRT